MRCLVHRVSVLGLTLATGTLIAGCGVPASSAVLSPMGQTVRVGRSDAEAACVELGPVETTHGSGCGMFGRQGTYEDAYVLFRNRAAELGANYLRLDQQVPPHSESGCYNQEFTIRGVAFRCP